jgi:hypothetical protein
MESNQLNSPKVFSHKGQGKSTHFQAQMKRVFAALYTTNPELFPIVEPSNTVKL